MHANRHKHATQHARPTPAKTAQPVVAAPVKSAPRPVTADEVRLLAYRMWEQAGRPTGDGVQFWLEAEQELKEHK